MEPGTIIMAAITFASVIVALYSVWDSKHRYFDSILPIISFRLLIDNGWLALEILNTGKSPAHNLTVRIVGIAETEMGYNPDRDLLSGTTFDLYPEEVVCNYIALADTKPKRAIVTLDLIYNDDWDDITTIRRKVSLFNEKQI